MKKKKRTLLWEIQHPNNTDTSYVFGTMHVKDEKVFHMLEKVKEKIDQVEVLANEFHFAEMQEFTDPTAMQLPQGITLPHLIKPKVYTQLGKLLQKEAGTSIQFFQRTLPLLLSNVLAESVLSSERSVSLDETLYRYALEQEKQTLGIESYAEQIETLKKIPLKYQVKSLIWMTKNFGAYRKETLKMRRYYEESAIDKLYEASKKSLKGMRKILLYNRNEVMAKRIADITEGQSMVCAIGAAHLWGKKGVLRLLKVQGLTIKPL